MKYFAAFSVEETKFVWSNKGSSCLNGKVRKWHHFGWCDAYNGFMVVYFLRFYGWFSKTLLRSIITTKFIYQWTDLFWRFKVKHFMKTNSFAFAPDLNLTIDRKEKFQFVSILNKIYHKLSKKKVKLSWKTILEKLSSLFLLNILKFYKFNWNLCNWERLILMQRKSINHCSIEFSVLHNIRYEIFSILKSFKTSDLASFLGDGTNDSPQLVSSFSSILQSRLQNSVEFLPTIWINLR